MSIAAPGNPIERFITAGIYQYTVTESKSQRLPGQFDGPGDAYRHIVLAAELTRVFGEQHARDILGLHEIQGWVEKSIGINKSQTQERENMDNESNERGIAIGNAARKTSVAWGDMHAFTENIVPAAREEITRAYEQNSGWWMRDGLWTEPKDGSAYPKTNPKVNWPPYEWDVPAASEANPDHLALPDYFGKAGYESIANLLPALFLPIFSPALDALFQAFRLAELWQRRDPIILDLDGDGVETLAQASGRHFDHDGNGFAEQSGWVGADDGLLIRDRQPGAEITSGSQLFGDFTLLSNGKTAAHGFEALADLDDNHDGVIDQADAAWAELAIWKDSNSDAYFDPGERLSLEQAGIRQLRLSYRHGRQVDSQGNQHLQLGSYLTSQGEERAMEDIGFSVDLARTQELERLALDPDIEALPDLAGLGNVRSLHQAMQRDQSRALKSIVLQWTQASEEERAQLIRPLIFRWTGVFEQSATPLPGLSDGRMLAALEALFGHRYRNGAGIQGEIPGQQLEKVFNDFAEVTSALLESNKLLSPIIQRLDFTWDDVSENFVINVEQAAQYLVESQAVAPSAAHLKRLHIALLGASDFGSEILDAFKKLALQSDDGMRLVLLPVCIENPILGTLQADSISGTAGNDFIDGASGDDRIQAGDGADSLFGGGGNDQLYGGNGEDGLYGGAGNDVLYGERGSDVLEGGSGDDVLYGGIGDDVYVFGKGDGKDVIAGEFYYWWDGGVGYNVLKLKSGVTADEVISLRLGKDLLLSIAGTSDSVFVSNFFWDDYIYNSYAILQGVEFADGSRWDMEQIKAGAMIGTAASETLRGTIESERIVGDGGEDVLLGLDGNDELDGGDENDQLYGGNGEDGLYGGAGNDVLYGERGSDVLEGGSGDDVLYGGIGDDVYVFGKGDGRDVIAGEFYHWWDGGVGYNVLKLKSGVTADELSLTRIGDGLVLSIEGAEDVITASNFFYDNNPGNGYNTLQEIRFADGSSWDMAAMLKTKGLTGTAGSGDLAGSDWSDTISGLAGDDAMYGLGGDDLLIGGLGNDQIIAGNGNDFLIGGAGNDQLFGGFGSDIYSFGRGDGADVIVDNDVEPGQFNRLNFGDDVAPSDVVASQEGDDLVLSILQSSDSVRVVDFYRSASPLNPCNSIQEIGFADGSVWGLSHFS